MQKSAPPPVVEEHEFTLDAGSQVLSLRERDRRENTLHRELKQITAKQAAGLVLHPNERARLDAIADRLLLLDQEETRDLGLLYEIVYRTGSVFEFVRVLWVKAAKQARS